MLTNTSSEQQKPLGLIDTLSLAFATVARQAWLLLLPLGLDFLLWRGAWVSLTPLFDRGAALFVLPPEVAEQEAELAAQARLLHESILAAGQHFNALSLLVVRFLGMPSLLADAPSLGGPYLFHVTVQDPWGALALVGGLGLLGIFVTCFWLEWLGRVTRRLAGTPDLNRPLLSGAVRTCGKLVLLFVIGVVLGLALTVPISLVLALLTLVSPAVGVIFSSVVSFGLLVVGFWLALHLYFVVQAMILNDDGLIQAVVNSFRVVRQNFWSALGLIGLVFLLGQGFYFIWLRLAKTGPGLLAAMLGNAFLGTGLTLAVFLFYQERFRCLRLPAGERLTNITHG